MLSPNSAFKTIKGFGMVEVMATLAVVTVGLVGLGGMQLQANRSIQDSGNRSQATWILDDLMNRIRANAESAAAYDTAGVAVSCNAPPDAICANYHSGDGGQVASSAACTNASLATFDLYDVACPTLASITDSSVTRSKPVDQLANPELTVAVNTFGLNDTSFEVTISLSWDVRTSGTDKDGNQIYLTNDTSVGVKGDGTVETQSQITSHRSTITRVFNP